MLKIYASKSMEGKKGSQATILALDDLTVQSLSPPSIRLLSQAYAQREFEQVCRQLRDGPPNGSEPLVGIPI